MLRCGLSTSMSISFGLLLAAVVVSLLITAAIIGESVDEVDGDLM